MTDVDDGLSEEQTKSTFYDLLAKNDLNNLTLMRRRMREELKEIEDDFFVAVWTFLKTRLTGLKTEEHRKPGVWRAVANCRACIFATPT